MGIGDFLFGEKPSVEQYPQQPKLTAEQQALLKQIIGDFTSGASGLPEKGVTPYTGELVAPLSNLEGLSLEALEQQIMNRVSGGDATTAGSEALKKLIGEGGRTIDFEPFYESAIRDPALQEFKEFTLPEITRRFGSSGAFGSDRRLAEQQGLERLGKTLVGARSELAYKSETDAANRLLTAIGLTPTVEGSGVDQLIKLMGGASLPRQIEQAKRTAEYTEFIRQQAQKDERIKQILAALGVSAAENVFVSKGGSEGAAGGIIEAGIGALAFGGFFSDRRLKHDIKYIHTFDSGLNLYEFRYNFDPSEVHLGVMADEVAELLPDAVITRDDGYKLVDYNRLICEGLIG